MLDHCLGPDSPTWKKWSVWPAAKLYHQAYEVDDLTAGLAFVEGSARARVLVPPTPAVAFEGRHVVFVMTPTRLVWELIEAP